MPRARETFSAMPDAESPSRPEAYAMTRHLLSRRTLVRRVVGLGIGLPVFGGLLAACSQPPVAAPTSAPAAAPTTAPAAKPTTAPAAAPTTAPAAKPTTAPAAAQ